MSKSKVLLAGIVCIASFLLISQVGAVSFSVSVTPRELWPGEEVQIMVETDPECVGVIIVWKPLLYHLDYFEGVEPPIDDWCEFLEFFDSYPEEIVCTADILLFDSYGIESTYPTTWEETTQYDPYTFDCSDPSTHPELPVVLWNDDWQGCQEYFYGEYAGPNTGIVGKYFVVVFAADGEWMESLLENICSENWDTVYELICNPPWIGFFITNLLVIPELFLGTITAVATPLLAFTTLSKLQRKRRNTE